MQYKKIYLEITNNCNLNCDFCIKNKRKQQFITIDEFNTTLDKIKPYTNYLYFHILGEPLMHPKINELISNAKEKEFNVNITTNGYLIKRIKDYNTNIKENIDNFKINNYLFINNFHEFIWPDLNNDTYLENGTCYALKDHIGILVDGTIISCCLDTVGNINLGNIYKDNLEDVINSKRYKNMLEGFKNHKKCEELCKHCKFLDTK